MFADLTQIDESTLIDKCQLLDPIADDDDIDWNTDPFEMRPDRVIPETPCHNQSLRFAMAPRTAEEPLSRIDQHLLYIGPVPASTGRPNGYRNRSNEVGGAAQPPPSRHSHPHADQQTAGARRHRGIAGQHLQAMVNGLAQRCDKGL